MLANWDLNALAKISRGEGYPVNQPQAVEVYAVTRSECLISH
jgi:hypothetical protein